MFLTVIHIIVSVLIIIAILLQVQGSGLSTTFGGGGEFYRSKRSLEKVLFIGTIALSVIFAVLSLLLLLPQ